jgi:hypothetical protein
MKQLIEINWLEQQRRELSFGEAAHLVLNLIDMHPRKEDHRQSRAMSSDIVQHVKPIHTRHLQIEQKHVTGSRLQGVDRGLPTVAFLYFAGAAAQEVRQSGAFRFRIVGEDNSYGGGRWN